MTRSISVALALSIVISAAAASLNELSKYCFPANTPASVAPPVWLPDESAIVRLSPDGKQIVTVAPESDEVIEVIFDTQNTRELSIDAIEGFIISPDARQILVSTDVQKGFRRSEKAKWFCYERHSRILRPLSSASEFQREPLWSPDSRMVAFVDDDNNIRIRKTDYNTEVAVTSDGARNKIINGATDWTYEEEFTVTSLMAWADDALTLAYVKSNETDVPQYAFSLYEGACDPMTQYALYPGSFEYKYPLAGVANSKVSLHSYDVETRRTRDIPLPAERVEYIPRIAYAPGSSDMLVVTTLNRDQNRMELFNVNPRSTTARTLLVEESNSGWIEPLSYEGLKMIPEGIVFASSRNGWTHLYLYSYAGAPVRQLTKGDFEVTAYYGYDPRKKLHYYQSTASGPENRMISSVDERSVVRNITPEAGTADAWFSPSAKWAMTRFSSVTRPPVFTLINPATGRDVRRLEENSSYASRYVSMPRREFFTLPADDQGPTLSGYIIRPQGNIAKAPVIMFQYSGPGSQQVLNRWSVDWENYFAMQGFMIVCVDGRGTAGHGTAFREAVYKRLGYFETIDQLRAARYAASLPGVDPQRIGIFGWSYGGYETLMAASAPSNPYAAAVAVAPVTDWRYYDTVYTERYMLTPQQNEDGYDEASTLDRISNLNARLLIMHGTADDNVHLANTMEYVSRLIADGKYCDMFLFPNMNHSINYCNGRAMVYWRMFNFFAENL